MLHKVSTIVKTDGNLGVAEANGHKIALDISGTGEHGMVPGEAVLAALGACQCGVAAMFAESQGFSFDEFFIEVEGDVDTDGFMGLSDVRAGFLEIRYKLHIKTKESAETAEKFAAFIASRCPVGETLENGTKMIRTGIVID